MRREEIDMIRKKAQSAQARKNCIEKVDRLNAVLIGNKLEE